MDGGHRYIDLSNLKLADHNRVFVGTNYSGLGIIGLTSLFIIALKGIRLY